MRISHKAILKIGVDANFKDKLFETDETLAESIIDAFDGQKSGTFSIPGAASYTMKLGDLTAVKGMFLKFDADADVDINGLGDISVVRASTATGVKAKLLMEATITSVAVTNPDATVALTGVWCIWGDL